MTQPTYISIRASIRKVKTIRQLDRAQQQVVNYAGPYHYSKRLYEAYNNKNQKIRNK